MTTPAAWAGRKVEVLTGPGYGPGWWFFEGQLAVRMAAAEHTGSRVPQYLKTQAVLEHPVHPGVFGAVWKERKP